MAFVIPTEDAARLSYHMHEKCGILVYELGLSTVTLLGGIPFPRLGFQLLILSENYVVVILPCYLFILSSVACDAQLVLRLSFWLGF